MNTYPVAYKQDPPEVRNRLTVFFRYFCIIPHAFVGMFYGIGAFFAIVCAWFAIVFTGKYPPGLYKFVASVMYFSTRLNAYLYLLTDEFPSFGLEPEPNYPVAISIGPPLPEYNRVKTLFRGIIGIPVMVILYVMSLWITVVAIVLWFAGVFAGRTSRGMTESLRMPMAYLMRSYAYLALLTEDWPPFEPGPNQLASGQPGQPPLPGGPGGPPNPGGPEFVKN